MGRQRFYCCRFFAWRACPLLFLIVQVMAYSRIAQADGKGSYTGDVRKLCGYTRFPDDCLNSLTSRRLPTAGTYDYALVAFALVGEITEKMGSGAPMFSLKAATNARTQEAIEYCNELADMSMRKLNQSLNALRVAPAVKKEDIQTWLSAALTFQENGKDALNEVQSPLSGRIERLSTLYSNALAIANRIPGHSETGSSRRKTSEERIPTWVTAIGHHILGGAVVEPSAVVAADGSGDFTRIYDALAGTVSKGGPTVIFVKAGVYNEKLTIDRDDVTLIGEGKDSTIITYGSSVRDGTNTADSATVSITGDRFIAKDITFENSAGRFKAQAPALRIISDCAVCFKCGIRGYQDTLFAQALRQFYRECDILGTIDFIFGNAAAVFQECNLVFRKPRLGNFNTMMANGRTDPGQNTGFVAQKCTIQASSELSPVRYSVRSYLGRPWKKYSRAVVIESNIDDFIQPSGWSVWSGGLGLETLYFAEGLNQGPGAGTYKRVDWPGFHVIGSRESFQFTVSNFIQGTNWIPSTGVTFQSGLYSVL